MLKFQFKINSTNQIEPKLLKKRDAKLVVDIQGRLEVLVNDKCFFSEPSLALLELGIALKKWHQGQEFYYFTIEHDEREGPILAFINNEENHWTIFSIWQLFESKEILTLTELVGAVDLFLDELNQELLNSYGIKLDDFVNRRRFFKKSLE